MIMEGGSERECHLSSPMRVDLKSETTITFIMYSCYDYPPDFINVTIRAPKHEKRNTT
jgi:hypothetical protein